MHTGKKHNLKDYLQPRWKDPYQVLLTSSCIVKLKGIDSWISISHLESVPALDWSIEMTADLKITFKQHSNRLVTTPTPG